MSDYIFKDAYLSRFLVVIFSLLNSNIYCFVFSDACSTFKMFKRRL